MLEDTSFAIHPGKDAQEGRNNFKDIGNLVTNEVQEDIYQFICENGTVNVVFYTEEIARVIMNPDMKPDMGLSKTAINRQPMQVEMEESESTFTLRTNKLTIEMNKQPFRLKVMDSDKRILLNEKEIGMGSGNAGEVICYKTMEADDHFYGFGEKSGFLDKRGEKYEMWNTDVFAPHNPETDPLYESIPYFMTLRNGRAHGVFFDNTYRTFFDMKTIDEVYSFMAEGGQLDYYIFAGPAPKDVLEQYTWITGRMPLPPKWALGYHQSRYSYETEQEVRELADTFREKDIPVDVIYLDIHYMNGYRVFTFDKDRFPEPKKLIEDLRESGIRIVPIVDPGVKKDPEYAIYQQGITDDLFCKYLEGNVYFGDVWPGVSAFPDFTDEKVRDWWGQNHKFYTDMGIEGIWNDMNEPAVFNETKTMDTEVMHKNDGSPETHRALHNVYGLLMGKATYEGLKEQLNGKRPFLLTRAGYAGVQRYAAVWTGDNRSFWEHLQMSLPMCMNLGLSGVAFTGPDVGGFAHDANAELLTRWTQVGAFTPYFRNHSAIGTLYQEPWRFGETHGELIKKYIELRYKWMPQLYSVFREASEKGLPVMRPLFMEFPEDEKTYRISDQFMIGNNVLVAPVMAPGVTDRAVYLPEGEWTDYLTGDQYEGGKAHLVHAELDHLPIFVRKGTAIMEGNVVPSMDTKQTDLTLHVYASRKNDRYQYTFYDDDGETFSYENGSYKQLDIEIQCGQEGVNIDVINQTGSYKAPYEQIKVEVHGLEDTQQVTVNGQKDHALKIK
ncbi:glycoside hydrolase family 31 protein [Sediminibacillus massiliensis]|uniref:glycoside hydrolase family 31 protein n=1 Tax=Sediminibacillus massiliensis TaxID=1926277 RepID=UPI00098851BB|nr:glycoside hydrolase family 31 protein [Sediminibacillus massiliensis]